MTKMTRPHVAHASLVLLLAASLSGCMVGPNYTGPPDVAPLASKAGAFHRADTAPTMPAEPPARWWEALNDSLLTRLIDQAMADSPTLKQAEARLRNARATVNERRAGLLPEGTAEALYARTRVPTGDVSSLLGGETASSATSTSTTSATSSTSTSSLGSDFSLY
ncbi:MAG: hypothetical protein ACYDD1_15605, partial [Caulobacteraceae bacterium]